MYHLNSNEVIEVGPGKGRLTEFLARATQALTLVEVDYNLWRRLQEQYRSNKQVKVHCGDFMDYELPSEDYVVVSNLPFFLARTILLKLLKAPRRPKAIYVVVQEDLYHQLRKLTLAHRFNIKVLHAFRRADFEPIPRVESVFVQILPVD